jgi:Spy/CpxP family protein refolding chaperone
MKNKLISILTGATVLTAPLTSTVVQAQTTSLTQIFPSLSGVSLTQEQQTQLEQLSQQTLPEVENVLTDEQRSQFETALAEGKGVRVALLSVNPSAQQQKQIQDILRSKKNQITKTLTPQQKRQVMQNFWSLQQQGN